jgi:hypothetical protein
MHIFLGNLKIEQIEQRLGFKLSDEAVKFMNNNHQESAKKIEKGKWHCFDIPFNITCGDMETAEKIRDFILASKKDNKFKETLHFSIENNY